MIREISFSFKLKPTLTSSVISTYQIELSSSPCLGRQKTGNSGSQTDGGIQDANTAPC